MPGRSPQKPAAGRRKAEVPAAAPEDVMCVAGHELPFRRVPIDAWLQDEPSAAPHTYEQREFALACDVSPQTLREWSHRGLPVLQGSDGRPRYDARALWWVIVWQRRARRGLPAPRHLGMQEVEREWLDEQRREDPAGWLLVPLDWSHPLRRELLARAVAGRRPEPLSDASRDDDPPSPTRAA